MDSPLLDVLRGFAAGEIQPRDFRDRLYAEPGFEALLTKDPHLRHGNYVSGSAYLFLLECDFDDPTGVLDAHGAVCDYLDRNGYEYARTNEYADFYEMVIGASPHWFTADPKFVRDRIMPETAGRTGAELRSWLADQLLNHYRYVAKPPEWIQSPDWPHGAAGPLVFLGQIDVPNYFHDIASAYVFHDPATGECQTIIQCY